MTTKQSLYFSYDGIDCRQFNVTRVNSQSGLFEEKVGAERSIIEESVPGNPIPYYFGFETSPIEDSFEIMIGDNADQLTDENLFRIQEWLLQDEYKELYFHDQPEKLYYAMFTTSPVAFHNGAKAGYIQLTYRCNSSYVYSPVYTEQAYIVSDTTTQELLIENRGHFKIKPIIHFKKVGNGSLSITNKSNGGNTSIMANLIDGEEIVIDMDMREIETNITAHSNLYRDFNDIYLEFLKGKNRLDIKGKGFLKIEYQYMFHG